MDAIVKSARSQWGSLQDSASALAAPPARSEFEQFRRQLSDFFAPQSVEHTVIGTAPKLASPVRSPKLAKVAAQGSMSAARLTA